MFCPKCRYEYIEIYKICPDCSELLVPELPPEVPEEKQEGDFPTTVFAIVRDQAEEHLLMNALQENGIECISRMASGNPNKPYLKGSGPFFGADYPMSIMLHEIVINADKLEQAKEVLAQLRLELQIDKEEKKISERTYLFGGSDIIWCYLIIFVPVFLSLILTFSGLLLIHFSVTGSYTDNIWLGAAGALTGFAMVIKTKKNLGIATKAVKKDSQIITFKNAFKSTDIKVHDIEHIKFMTMFWSKTALIKTKDGSFVTFAEGGGMPLLLEYIKGVNGSIVIYGNDSAGINEQS